jgi:hypothetical protein
MHIAPFRIRTSFFPFLMCELCKIPSCSLMWQPLKVFSILTFCHICGHFNSQVVTRTQPILTTHHLPTHTTYCNILFLLIRYRLQ